MSNIERREQRIIPLGKCELRAKTDGESPGIHGLGIVYGMRADIGPFVEEILPGAAEQALREFPEINSDWNHNSDYPLGSTLAGTMTVRETDDGVEYDIPSLPKSRADVAEAIERREVFGSSFVFSMPAGQKGEKWSKMEDGRDLRTITRIARIYSLDPVRNPAYVDTSVALRSRDAALGRSTSRVTDAQRIARAKALARDGWRATVRDIERDLAGAAQRERERKQRARTARIAAVEASPVPKVAHWGAEGRQLALHEAAHAVVGAELGNPAQRIVADYQATPAGWDLIGATTWHTRAVRDAEIDLAGPLADAIFHRRTHDIFARNTGTVLVSPDWLRTVRDSSDGRATRTSANIDAAAVRAWDIVRNQWATIERVADAFVAVPGGVLSGARIAEIIKASR